MHVITFAVLKVLRIEDTQFSEVCNLRIREMVNLSYSATDVAWSPLEGLTTFIHISFTQQRQQRSFYLPRHLNISYNRIVYLIFSLVNVKATVH